MNRIIDPRRMLNGFSFDPQFIPSRCYVLGCRELAIVGRRHVRFGLVDACASHDPDRHAYSTPLIAGAAIAPPATTPPRALSGGQKVRSRRPVPILPTPGIAQARPF